MLFRKFSHICIAIAYFMWNGARKGTMCTFCWFECNQVCIHTIVTIIIIMCVYKLFCAVCCWDSFEKLRMQMHTSTFKAAISAAIPSTKKKREDIFIVLTVFLYCCRWWCLYLNLRDHLTNEDHGLCFHLNYFKNFPTEFSCVYFANANVSENSTAISNYRHTINMLLMPLLLLL